MSTVPPTLKRPDSKAKKPPKQTKAQLDTALHEKLLAGLQAAKESRVYPLAVKQLAISSGERPEDALKLLSKKGFKDAFLLANSKDPESPLALSSDEESLANSELLIRYVANQARANRSRGGKPLQAPLAKLAADAGLKKPLASSFVTALNRRLTSNTLPAEVIELLPPSTEEICRRLITLVERQASTDFYPVSEKSLLELCKAGLSTAAVKKLFKAPSFAGALVACHTEPSSKTAAKGFALRSDIEAPNVKLVLRALRQAKSLRPAGKRASALATSQKKSTTAFSSESLASALVVSKEDQSRFVKAIEHAADKNRLPPQLAWVHMNGMRAFFLLVDVSPAPASLTTLHITDAGLANIPDQVASLGVEPSALSSRSAVSSFNEAFERAFSRANARSGNVNFVKLIDLRRELPQYSQSDFDAGLRELRIAERYSLDSSDGNDVQTNAEERAAGIQEGRSLFVYASRR